jgi:hypothetical protein
VQLIDIIEDIERKNEKFKNAPQKIEKSLTHAFNSLVEACCFPIKSEKIDNFLEIWIASAKWTEKAKEFLEDKLTDE